MDTISPVYARLVLRDLEQRGLDPAPLFTGTRLTRQELLGGGDIGLADFLHILSEGQRMSPDRGLGLMLGRNMHTFALGPLGAGIAIAPTVRAGLQLLESYTRLHVSYVELNAQFFSIDVGFGQVRPSPWRQAVDLANMMLVLALGSSPERVYDRARERFTDDELAEAFAASKGVTLPSALRRSLRQDGRELLEQFRQLAPERRPVSIQRWSLRRVGLTLWVVLVVVAISSMFISNLGDVGLR